MTRGCSSFCRFSWQFTADEIHKNCIISMMTKCFCRKQLEMKYTTHICWRALQRGCCRLSYCREGAGDDGNVKLCTNLALIFFSFLSFSLLFCSSFVVTHIWSQNVWRFNLINSEIFILSQYNNTMLFSKSIFFFLFRMFKMSSNCCVHVTLTFIYFIFLLSLTIFVLNFIIYVNGEHSFVMENLHTFFSLSVSLFIIILAYTLFRFV